MSELRPFALVRSADQWVRCSCESTFVDLGSGTVELGWTTSTADAGTAPPPLAAGLAFDHACRLYHSLPDAGRVERLRWAAIDPALPDAEQPAPVDLFEAAAREPLGDFASSAPAAALAEPRGLAVDNGERLFVAETGADRVLVHDLWDGRLVQRIPLPAGARPTDLAAAGHGVLAVLAGSGSVLRLSARSAPKRYPLPAGCTQPSRIAVSPGGQVAVLARAAGADARVWLANAGGDDFEAADATDLEWESDEVLVVARGPGADFLRWRVRAGQRDELSPLRARGYDGLGIVALPVPAHGDAASPRRIGFWTARGPRGAVPARLVHARRGRVTTYRLDSGAYQTTWGRVFVDACIPEGSYVRLHCIALDDVDDEAALPRLPPANVALVTLKRPDLTPPMPPLRLAPGPGEVTTPLHRRESGRELPWTQPSEGDRFVTYEAPVLAAAGRYLWLTLELRGNTRVTPKIRCLRAEHPSHDLLRRLPATFSREVGAASFLRRYLAMFDGFLSETEARGVDRDLLLDPRSTPAEALPWLASFMGLVLDERWASAPSRGGSGPVDARRMFIEEAAWLFRFRGTLPGLRRFVEIYTGVAVVVIEHWRLRGLGVAVLGDAATAEASSVVGYGFRVGGAVASQTALPIEGSVGDAFGVHAHRFTVVIPAALDPEQLEVVEHIVRVHRPAHTVFDLCTVDSGMRVGNGLLLGLTSVIGRSGGFKPLQLGGSTLGRGAIVGRPGSGARLGNAALGVQATVG